MSGIDRHMLYDFFKAAVEIRAAFIVGLLLVTILSFKFFPRLSDSFRHTFAWWLLHVHFPKGSRAQNWAIALSHRLDPPPDFDMPNYAHPTKAANRPYPNLGVNSRFCSPKFMYTKELRIARNKHYETFQTNGPEDLCFDATTRCYIKASINKEIGNRLLDRELKILERLYSQSRSMVLSGLSAHDLRIVSGKPP